jgi:hypothetical protein
VRAPVLNASLTDCVFELQRATTAEEVNALFAGGRRGAAGRHPRLRGTRRWCSADYARDTRSSIVDALSTMVTDGTLLKVYAWYDNEMGYACRMVDLACHLQISRHLIAMDAGTPPLRRPSRPPTGASRSPTARCACWCCCTSTGSAIPPFTLAFLFLLYEAAGIVANLVGGWLATRFGISRMLSVGPGHADRRLPDALGAARRTGRRLLGGLGGGGAGHLRRGQGPHRRPPASRPSSSPAGSGLGAACSSGWPGSPAARTP